MTLDEAVRVGVLERGSVKSVLKSSADTQNALSTLVVLQRDDLDREVVSKVYPWADREYATAEFTKATLLSSHSQETIQTPKPADWIESPELYIRNDYLYIPGGSLSARRGSAGYSAAAVRTILNVIPSFAGIQIDQLDGPHLHYSSPQGMYCWVGRRGGFPNVPTSLLLDEYSANVRQCRRLLGVLASKVDSWMDRVRPKVVTIAEAVKGVIHSDLIADNILVLQQSIALIDVGLAMYATLFHEWGGAISHLGPAIAQDVLRAAASYCRTTLSVAVDPKQVAIATAAFAIHRAVRRLAYLASIVENPHSDGVYVSAQILHQRSTLEWATNQGDA